MYRVAKLSVPSTIRSYCSKISRTLSRSSAVLWITTLTSGLISRIESRGGLGLGPADVGLAVDDLALQVGLVDGVEVDDAERADPGGGQVHQGRRAEAAGADAEHPGVLQPLLPVHPDVRDDQVAGVAADLVNGQLGGGLDERGQRHGDPFPTGLVHRNLTRHCRSAFRVASHELSHRPPCGSGNNGPGVRAVLRPRRAGRRGRARRWPRSPSGRRLLLHHRGQRAGRRAGLVAVPELVAHLVVDRVRW